MMKTAALALLLAIALPLGAHASGDEETCSPDLHPHAAPAIPQISFLDAETPRRAAHATEIGNALDMEHIRADMLKISGEAPLFPDTAPIKDRFGVRSRKLVRKFLGERLRQLGFQTQEEPFVAQIKKPSGTVDKAAANVIGEIRGTRYPEQTIEVIAHFDTAGWGVRGADDNGSGVSAALEMARVLSQHAPERTLRFVFVDLEEGSDVGLHGSRAHAQNLAHRGESIAAAVVIDGFGYYPADRGPGEFVLEVGILPDHRSREDALLQSYHVAETFRFQALRTEAGGPRMRTAFSEAAPDFGDHGPYWRTGYPAVFISVPFDESITNPAMHTKDDRIDLINWPYYRSITKLIGESVALLAGCSPDAPLQLAALDDLAHLPGRAHFSLLPEADAPGVEVKPLKDSVSMENAENDLQSQDLHVALAAFQKLRVTRSNAPSYLRSLIKAQYRANPLMEFYIQTLLDAFDYKSPEGGRTLVNLAREHDPEVRVFAFAMIERFHPSPDDAYATLVEGLLDPHSLEPLNAQYEHGLVDLLKAIHPKTPRYREALTEVQAHPDLSSAQKKAIQTLLAEASGGE